MTLFYECNENRVKKTSEQYVVHEQCSVPKKRERKKLGTVDVRSQCDKTIYEAAL